MENSIQIPYSDVPRDPQRVSSPTSSHVSSAAIKPLPSLPAQPLHTRTTYPTETNRHKTLSQASPPIQPPRYQDHPTPFRPYTDLPSPSEALSPTLLRNDDDVPLASLLFHPQPHAQAPAYLHPHAYHLDSSYPLEAPPSYSIAVRQSFRETLIHHIPSHGLHDPLAPEVDEESGLELVGPDDVRYAVEKVVAMFVVAILLLILSGILAWLALGSGIWD